MLYSAGRQLSSLEKLMPPIGHPAIEAAAEKQNMTLESKESRLSMAISHQRFGAATTRRVRAKFMRNLTAVRGQRCGVVGVGEDDWLRLP